MDVEGITAVVVVLVLFVTYMASRPKIKTKIGRAELHAYLSKRPGMTVDETKNGLAFGTEVAGMKNVILKEVEAEVARLQAEIDAATEQLESLKRSTDLSVTDRRTEMAKLTTEIVELEATLARKTQETITAVDDHNTQIATVKADQEYA